MPPPTSVDLVVQLEQAVNELRGALAGNAHGIFRGSHEAALAEAQGLKIYKSPAKDETAFSHLDDLANTEATIASKEARVNSLLGKIGEDAPGVMTRLKEKLQPLLEQSKNYRETIGRTRDMAARLKGTSPSRLESAWANKGGLKVDAGRSNTSLVSTQMEQQSAALRAQGIDPVLVPNPTAAEANQLAAIRQLPVNEEAAATRIASAAENAKSAVSEARGLAARWGSGGTLFGIGINILSMIVRQKAMEKEKKTDGYAPVGPGAFASEGLLSRLGRVFQDMTLGTQIPIGERFDLSVWRARIREHARGIAVGGTVTMDWQIHDMKYGFQSVEDVYVTYEKSPDGTWRALVPSGGREANGKVYFGAEAKGRMVPDLNVILNGTDWEVQCQIFEGCGAGTLGRDWI
jgi:hypothetical protein